MNFFNFLWNGYIMWTHFHNLLIELHIFIMWWNCAYKSAKKVHHSICVANHFALCLIFNANRHLISKEKKINSFPLNCLKNAFQTNFFFFSIYQIIKSDHQNGSHTFNAAQNVAVEPPLSYFFNWTSPIKRTADNNYKIRRTQN